MVDRDQRLAVGERDRLGRGQPDNDAADQAGARRRRNAVNVGEGLLRLGHRGGDDAVERFDMGACGDFRHDAAEFRMLIDLG